MKKLIAKLFGLYTKAQMVSFGNYLLSDTRKDRVQNVTERVHDADFDNWENS